MKSMDELKDKLPYTPVKKKESEVLLFTSYSMKKGKMSKTVPAGGSQKALRDATLSASVSPFLRAVLLLGESDSHYFLFVLEPSEEKLHPRELAGALVHFDTPALAIKEQGVNYYFKPKGLTTMLTKEAELMNLKNISLANIHHDYVRYFGGGRILEEVITFHLLHNDFTRSEKVIRKV